MRVEADIHNEWLLRSVALDYREHDVVFPGCKILSVKRLERELDWVILRTGLVGSPFPIEAYVDDSLVVRFTNDTIRLYDPGDVLNLHYTLSWYWYNDEDGQISPVPMPGYTLELEFCLCA